MLVLSSALVSCDSDDPRCNTGAPHPDCPPDPSEFSLEPRMVQLGEGEEVDVEVVFQRNGYSGSVDLWIEQLPSGITATFSPNPIPANSAGTTGSSTLTLTNVGAEEGTYTASVFATRAPGYVTLQIVVGPAAACAPWRDVPNVPSDGAYYDVDFVGNTGFVVGDDLLRSTDGGSTWALLPGPALPVNASFQDVSFPSANVGFLHASGGTILNQLHRTVDGGSTWEMLPTFPSANVIRDLLFVNDSLGFAVTGVLPPSVWRTVNGGNTWTNIPVPGSGNLVTIAATPEGGRLILGREGVGGLLYSNDTGLTWHQATAPGAAYNWVSFFDEQSGVAGGEFALARTTDGGLNWQASATPSTDRMFAGSARSNEQYAYAVGQGIWETRDRGASWQLVCSTPFRNFAAVSVMQELGRAVAVSDAIVRRY